MDDTESTHLSPSYSARLDRTLKALQDTVEEREASLDQRLRGSIPPLEPQPSEEPESHMRQLRTLKVVYESLTPKEPYLPSAESPLPALLALRATGRCIKETEDCIAESEAEVQKIQQRLRKEHADLSDARLIQTGLEVRILSLREEINVRAQKSPGHIAKDLMRDARKGRRFYDDETGKLVKAFNSFIDDHLAAMLAVEELGGPIVGGILDVDDAMLEVGFSTQGKKKKLKSNSNRDRRQQRIDKIWGARPPADGQIKEPSNEKQAAAAEIRELTEQLLNTLVEADGGPGAYIELQRESAAARFLVRSKVAQFHPTDARRLRLFDFGLDIDD